MRIKEQGLEKFRCWFSNSQILTCQRKQDVFYTERASELSLGRRRRFLWDLSGSEWSWLFWGVCGHRVSRAGQCRCLFELCRSNLFPIPGSFRALTPGVPSLRGQPQAGHHPSFETKCSQVSHPHGAVAASVKVSLDAAWLHMAVQPGLGLSLSPAPGLVTFCRTVACEGWLEPVHPTWYLHARKMIWGEQAGKQSQSSSIQGGQ